MKKSILRYLTIGAMGILTATSCTDYLDKEADSDVVPEEAFKNFTNFQGFIEEMYNCIPTKESNMWCCTFNWGEDEIMNTGLGDSHLTAQFDLGNYRNWYQNNQHYLHADNPSPTSTDKYSHSIEHAWYCIRKANVGLSNIDLLTANRDQRNAIEGQLYFFRAWWHEEQMIWFGGIPYIDENLDTNGDLFLPRLTFVECADKAYDDFMKAADLLPANWDNNSAGNSTKGNNETRISKATALAYAGKVMLWAASPLNKLGQGELGGKNTYNYDVERAKKAAEALGKAISLVEGGSTPFSLAKFEFSTVEDWESSDRGIYDHRKGDNASDYSNIWHTFTIKTQTNWKQPGTTEAMLRGPYIGNNGSNWNFAKLWGTKISNIVEHDAVIHMPTANYINYAYGMANGEPAYIVQNGELVINPASGFDPTHPFKDRDPRFYHDIVFDGFRYINAEPEAGDLRFQFCEMFTGGNLRDDANGTRTGYYCQKLVPHQSNKYDGYYNWGSALQCDLPYMRLAEVYLLYAEACAAAGGADYKASTCPLTSVDAINRLRDRVGAGHVSADRLNGNTYMDEVRRERACELAFEGFRWNDLQRWLLLTEKPYNIKTAQEFTRVGDYDFVKNDPAEAQVAGWTERVIVERAYQVKHYLLPFKNSDVTLYQGFTQNPGW